MINKTEKEIISYWDKKYDYPVVSICCTTYNHELYIEEALDSFLNQETKYPFEIVVHDDASTDSTPLIINKYYQLFPSIIKPIFQKNNQYSINKEKIRQKIYKTAKGNYFAFCEGDDYWGDNRKIDKQCKLMIENPSYSAVVHNTKIIGQEHGKISLINNYIFNSQILSKKILLDGLIILRIICQV